MRRRMMVSRPSSATWSDGDNKARRWKEKPKVNQIFSFLEAIYVLKEKEEEEEEEEEEKVEEKTRFAPRAAERRIVFSSSVVVVLWTKNNNNNNNFTARTNSFFADLRVCARHVCVSVWLDHRVTLCGGGHALHNYCRPLLIYIIFIFSRNIEPLYSSPLFHSQNTREGHNKKKKKKNTTTTTKLLSLPFHTTVITSLGDY